MDSKILLKEVVENKDRKFGANLEYYPCTVVGADDVEMKALFTEHDIDTAIHRALENQEDFVIKKSFWAKLFGG